MARPMIFSSPCWWGWCFSFCCPRPSSGTTVMSIHMAKFMGIKGMTITTITGMNMNMNMDMDMDMLMDKARVAGRF